MTGKVPVSFRIPVSFKRKVDVLVDRGLFKSKTRAFNTALELLFQKYNVAPQSQAEVKSS